MNLLQRLKTRFKKQTYKYSVPEQTSEDIKQALEDISKPVPPKPKGRVIKQTRATEFNPDPVRRGGRVVKVMPKKLQQLKEAQEKVESDSDQPKVEDLED